MDIIKMNMLPRLLHLFQTLPVWSQKNNLNIGINGL